MLASVLTDQVGTMLNDMEAGYEHIRWPVAELLGYLTEATGAIAHGKPSVFIVTDVLDLAPGTTQQIPEQFSKLLDIHFNINRDGSEGFGVLPGVHDLQQAFLKPGCSYNGVIQTFFMLSGSDKFYGVAPAVPAGLSYIPRVRAMLMLTPQVVTSATQPLYFPSSDPQLFQGALVDWMLYRAYSKDQESNTSMERSKLHFTAFQNYVGMSAVQRQATPQRVAA